MSELFNIKFTDIEKFYDSYLISPKKYFMKNETKDENDNVISIEFEKILIPSSISKRNIQTWWETSRNGKDTNVYSFNNENTFTLIIYDSRDYDSILCRDIILKQYSSVNNRDITDWKKNGIIAYDVFTKSSLYPTYEGFNIFYPELLTETGIDKVFICGYCISEDLLNTYSNYNEELFIFEDNPYKIEKIKTIVKASSSNRLCMTKNLIKSYQAFSLFRDPIGDLKPEDNIAIGVLKNYSDAVCMAYSSLDDWEKAEKIKNKFENEIKSDDESGLRKSLVNKLFGETVDYDFNNLYSNDDYNIDIEDLINKSSLNWTGNVLAINTDKIPSKKIVEKYVSETKQYSSILIFYKYNDDFWTIKQFRTPRKLENSLSTIEATPENIYYLENGTKVKKVVSYNGLDIFDVKWYILNNQDKITSEVNMFIEDPNGEYLLNVTKNYGYEKTPKKITKSNYLCDSDNNVVKFSPLSSIIFDEVYGNNDEILFNDISLINNINYKYSYRGCKYAVELSLTDKQMYKCLQSKSI